MHRMKITTSIDDSRVSTEFATSGVRDSIEKERAALKLLRRVGVRFLNNLISRVPPLLLKGLPYSSPNL
mgnify:CR=1 FL=1